MEEMLKKLVKETKEWMQRKVLKTGKTLKFDEKTNLIIERQIYDFLSFLNIKPETELDLIEINGLCSQDDENMFWFILDYLLGFENPFINIASSGVVSIYVEAE